MEAGRNKEIIEEISKFYYEPIRFIERYCKIQTKEAGYETIILNRAQREIIEYVTMCLKTERPIRIKIAKSRQLGMSTLVACLFVFFLITRKNIGVAIVAHKEKSTKGLFDKYKTIINGLDKSMLPMISNFNSEAIVFDGKQGEVEGLKNKLMFETASGDEILRGGTVHMLHNSEKAFWPDNNYENLQKSIASTVPNSALTCIIDESTANGYNFWETEVMMSKRKENDYKLFFFGWNYDDEAIDAVERILEKKSIKGREENYGIEFSEEEKAYQKLHKLTDRQMRWRHYVIINSYNGRVDSFKQEYPLFLEESFVTTGSSVFGGEVIEKGFAMAREPLNRYKIKCIPMYEDMDIYDIELVKEEKQYMTKEIWNKDKKIYEMVDDKDFEIGSKYYRYSYLVAVDTSGSGNDYNVITVWNTMTKRKVARWKKRSISERDLAQVCIEIAKMFNDAIIAPEINFSHSLVEFIVDDFKYKNVYVNEDIIRADKSTGGNKYGWITSVITKPSIVGFMRSCLAEDVTICPDKEFWEEAKYFRETKTDTGRVTYAASKGHDDEVMSSMIGRYLCDSPQVKQGYKIVTDIKEIENENNLLTRLFSGYRKESKKKKVLMPNSRYNNNA